MTDMEQLYQQRLNRYVTALRNEKPDRVPLRPFVAEFTAKYAGFTCQEVVHDYPKAFEAAVKCAKDFDWDAVVPNMVYVWTGLAQAAGLRYYGIPGIGIPHDVGFNYIEPAEDQAFMKADEYDALIADPTGFLYDVWLPRVSTEVCRPGAASTRRNHLALVKSAMAMLSYFYAFGPQLQRLRTECGTASAIAGIFKAPFDILADKLRGYIGLTMDMHRQPQKVLQACEALMPHLCHVGLTTADPAGLVPIGFWMHRGCVPFINPRQFESHYWPTLKPIIEEFWKNGHQTLFYAEGKWRHHFDAFLELPERSIVFHVDQDDVFEAHRRLHQKFALSGGIPNYLLSYGQPAEVRDFCARVLDEVAKDGGYIMDAGAIMQNDTSIENLRVMTEVVRERGVYSDYPPLAATPPAKVPASCQAREKLKGMDGQPRPGVQPGICFPWEEKAKELPSITGSQDLVRKVWEDIEAFGNMYIWQLLLSF
ncbi:MAG TPA: uroporphyrinogen decarboxylase family protein [Candidatus Paceibacterota bacterium]|nr:uroporphyrinogen decarboxylase family protein [Verrucomicrobiota bacterium]HRY47361.1 uroporphyrinogen decarboxylase family protein [Candidatus Paceibacterota bacterium]